MDKLRERLARPSFGAWISGDPFTCEIMGRAGYDWLILETQHRGLGPDAMVGALQAVELGGTPTMVRVGGIEPVEIMRALDIGAAGVVVPVVNTAAEARIAAGSMRYPPKGVRSFGPVRDRARRALEVDPVCVLMIETVEALSNLDEIASTPGVDVLLVGPADMALSMGLSPGAALEAPVLDAVDRVVEACRRHRVTPGCASYGFENARMLTARGVSFISVAADGAFLRRGVEEDRLNIDQLHREYDAGTS